MICTARMILMSLYPVLERTASLLTLFFVFLILLAEKTKRNVISSKSIEKQNAIELMFCNQKATLKTGVSDHLKEFCGLTMIEMYRTVQHRENWRRLENWVMNRQ